MSGAQPVRRILIVGGGTAGWMSATYLATQLKASGRRVTLVESKTIPIIGVGEATVPPLVGYFRVLGISEEEFMRRSHATYKLGIKFYNWHEGSDAFWHPFGPVGGSIDGMQLFHYWLQRVRAGEAEGPYTSYSTQALLGEMDKAPRGLAASSPVHERGQYAYHLDAGAFAEFLKGEAIRRGTEYIEDDVTDVVLDERGWVARVETRAHGALTADLYIDCSGFNAIIAEKALGDRYIDWSDLLLCDRALAAPQPLVPGDPIAPYTKSIALSAGWMWQIPLTQRAGNGYVFSSRFIGEDQAAREMAAQLGLDADRLAPRLLRMKVGRRDKFWRGNCIALGLSSGFVEPLESTGIFVIQRGLALLLSYFPDTGFEPQLARRYNERMGETYEEIRDFIILHYVLTRRSDSEFWRAYRELRLPDSLRNLLDLYDRTGLVEPAEHAMFPEPSWYSILAGHRRLPAAHHAGIELADPAKVRHIMGYMKSENEKLARSLPSHAAFIKALNSQAARASAA